MQETANISFNYETPSKILFSAGRKRIKSAHFLCVQTLCTVPFNTPTSVYYCVNTKGVQKNQVGGSQRDQSGLRKCERSVRSEVVRGITQV